MSKRIKYTDEPIEAAVVSDFLPPPDQLVIGVEDHNVPDNSMTPRALGAWLLIFSFRRKRRVRKKAAA